MGVPLLDGIHHVKIPVTDLARSREWYERVFGFTVELEFRDDDGVMRGLSGRLPGLGGTMLALRETPEVARAIAGFDPFGFGITDRAAAEAWVAWLDEQGVAHSPVIDATIGWLVVLHDPDGLELHLYSWQLHGLDPEGRAHTGRAVAS